MNENENIDKILHKYTVKTNNYLDKFRVEKLCIFGAGINGKNVISNFKKAGIDIFCVCDNDPNKTDGSFFVEGIKCIPFEELLKIKDEVTVCIAIGNFQDVNKQLVDNGFKNIFTTLENRLVFSEFWLKNSIDTFENDIKKAYNMLADDESKEVMKFCLDAWVDDITSYDKIKKKINILKQE